MTVPKKQQIVDDITRDIAAGTLPPGSTIPTTPQLRETYDVSVPTVRAAVDRLKQAGLVEFVPGVGIVVKQKKEPDQVTD